MDPSEAATHMKRCVASGLWVPEGGTLPARECTTDPDTGLIDKDDTDEEAEQDTKTKSKEEQIYEKVEDSID